MPNISLDGTQQYQVTPRSTQQLLGTAWYHCALCGTIEYFAVLFSTTGYDWILSALAVSKLRVGPNRITDEHGS